MRTTLDINDATLRELRELANRRKRPFREIVEETLQRGLSAPRQKRKLVRIKAYPVGIKAAYRGLSMNQLYDQVEAEAAQRVAES